MSVQSGQGFLSAIKKAGNYLKKSGIISKVGTALGSAGVPYAGSIGKAAASAGLGRKRRPGRPRKVGRPKGSVAKPKRKACCNPCKQSGMGGQSLVKF